MEKKFTLEQLVNTLIGGTDPVGDHGLDMEYLENLKVKISLVDKMLSDIIFTSEFSDDGLASRQQMGKEADQYLNNLYQSLKDIYEE